MMNSDEIRRALHASRVVDHGVAGRHGPLGLEHLAAAVRDIQRAGGDSPDERRVQRPISLEFTPWERLDELADAATKATAHPVSASEIATAILEQYVASAAVPQ
jgi:hypothetical protein